LFAAACCRRIWHSIPDERSRDAVIAAERYADGATTYPEMLSWMAGAEAVVDPWASVQEAEEQPEWRGRMESHPGYLAACAADPDVAYSGTYDILRLSSGEERPHQARLLRDIFGNPFRPVTVDPSWLRWNDGTVPKIAQGIYEERAFERLPILADALLDAGCDNEDILSHCRGEGPHVRGCWVIDLLLGKE
jgi:hypothetical protein